MKRSVRWCGLLMVALVQGSRLLAGDAQQLWLLELQCRWILCAGWLPIWRVMLLINRLLVGHLMTQIIRPLGAWLGLRGVVIQL
jgi:hypothetical protein